MNRRAIEHLDGLITSLVVPGKGLSFAGDDFRDLCKPCVYIFLKAGTPIYIGVSRRGIARATNHPKIRIECDELKVFPCKSEGDALKLEAAMICRFKPKHNRNGFGSHVRRFLGITQLCMPSAPPTSDNVHIVNRQA